MLSHALYTYCDNAPVQKKDEDGCSPSFAAAAVIKSLFITYAIYRYYKTATKADRVNKIARRKVITSKQVFKAAFSPVPNETLNIIRKRAESFWTYNGKLLFAYTDAPNYYVTYRLSSGGSIIREDRAYVKYRLTVEGNPLYETLAFAADVLNSKVDGFDPLPPWVQVGLTCISFRVGWYFKLV